VFSHCHVANAFTWRRHDVNPESLSEEDIFAAAFKLNSPEDRMDYLRQVCRDDDQIERIQSLLKEGDPEASFLEKGPAALQKDDNRPPGLPERIGDFEILGELGRGGMGVVYRSRQCSLNRLVALKVLSSGLGLTTKAIMRFKLEAEAAAKLHHTNIVPIYWTGEEKRVPYYAMELIDGPSLDRVIKQLRAPADASGNISDVETSVDQHVPDWVRETLISSSTEAADISTGADTSSLDSSASFGPEGSWYDNLAKMMADVADALAHAHDQGIVHRDIKPANLLLSSDGRLSINDFGLARMLEQPGMTMTGELMGSPMYMSPEQITAGRLPLDHRTDIYSLGASLYELLTLTPPFPGQQRDQVLSQVIHKDPPKPRSINPRIPRDLETICLKAMEKDPDRRYQTAEQMAKDLRCFVNRHAISARRTGPVERAIRWARKNKALTAMASLTLVIGVVSGVFWYTSTNATRELVENNQALEGKKQELADENQRLQREQAIEEALKKTLSGRFSESLNSIKVAITHGADPSWEPMLQSQQDLSEGKGTDALNKIKDVVQKDPSNLTAKWMLVSAYWSNGQAGLTYATLEEIIGKYPDRPLERLFAAQALSMFEPAEALKLLNDMLSENPQLTYARVARANITIFQAMNEKDGKINRIQQAFNDLQAATIILEEEQEDDANVLFSYTRLYAHLTAFYLYQKMDKNAEAEQHLKDARNDVRVLEENSNSFRAAFLRMYYYQFNQDFGGMYDVMQDVIKYGYRGWVADPFWATCYMNPQWAVWKPEWEDSGPLQLLQRMPHQDDEYVAFTRMIFRLEEAADPYDVEMIYRNYCTQRKSGSHFQNPLGLLLTGQRTVSKQLARDWLETNSPEEPGFAHFSNQYRAGKIGKQEFIDRAGRVERDLVTALYLIGLQELAAGKRQAALAAFKDATSTTLFHWTQFNWSRAFADRLEKDEAWPHWPMLSSPQQGLKDKPD
jgi:serine/threonine protein kinase